MCEEGALVFPIAVPSSNVPMMPALVETFGEMTFLERYKAGEQRQVWEELVSFGDAVREEPLHSDTWLVACETMRRIRFNTEMLIPRLAVLGWKFRQEPLTPPGDGPATTAAMEAICGPLPLSLKAFYEIVGGIDLRGAHPDWDDLYDPLMVASGAEVLQDLCVQRAWHEEEARNGLPAVPFTLYYAPDFLVKEGISGVGMVYVAVEMPDADAPLSFEDKPLEVSFVQSLRNSLRWGGFQGLVSEEAQFDLYHMPTPPTDLAALTAGFLLL